MSRREAFVNSIKRGTVIPDETLQKLNRAFAERTMDATITSDQYSWAAMQDMLGDLQDVADRAAASNLRRGDYSRLTREAWSMIYALLAMLDEAGVAY